MTDKTSDFQFSYIFPFEKNFDEESFWQWSRDNWHLSVWYALAYVILIFGGKYYMERRPRFEIRVALGLWSTILAIFSIFGALRTMPEMIYVIRKYGWEFSICNPSYVYYTPTAFWTALFALSKVYELGDTIFIVLRKQQLIFLHWYHHITVLIYCWYSVMEHAATGRWFMVMNYTVHSLMYSYYALKAMRLKIPKFVSLLITSLQLLQMVIGIVINAVAYNIKSKGGYCQQSSDNLLWSTLMYLSYFGLFSNFFYSTYIKKGNKTSAQIKHAINETNGFSDSNEFKFKNQ